MGEVLQVVGVVFDVLKEEEFLGAPAAEDEGRD